MLRDAATQVLFEIGVVRTVLRARPLLDAVVQNRLEKVKITARKVGLLVDDHARNLLAAAFAHDARFLLVDREAFGVDDLLHERDYQFRVLGHLLEAGERQVIRIARVIAAELSSQRR